MIVLNGDQVLEETLASVYPYAHQILIAEGPVGYWQQQGYTTSVDGTNEILENFPDPDNKIKIVHSQYLEKDDQCNAYMEFLDDETDYIWNLDCDEVFKPEDIEKVINLLETERYTSVGFKSVEWIDFLIKRRKYFTLSSLIFSKAIFLCSFQNLILSDSILVFNLYLFLIYSSSFSSLPTKYV